jgi:hypothetical protein
MSRLSRGLATLLLACSGCAVLVDEEPSPTPGDAFAQVPGPVWVGPKVVTQYAATQGEVVAFPPGADTKVVRAVRGACDDAGVSGALTGRTLRLVARLQQDNIAFVPLWLCIQTLGLFPAWVDFHLRVTGTIEEGGRVVAESQANSALSEWGGVSIVFLPHRWGNVSGANVDNEVVVEHFAALTRRVLADLLPQELATRAQEELARAQRGALDQAAQEAQQRRVTAFEAARRAAAEQSVVIGETDAAALAALGISDRKPQPDGTDRLDVASGREREAMLFFLGINGRLVRVVERAPDGAETDWTTRLLPEAVDAPEVSAPTQAGRTFVLVIGVDDYEDARLPDLRFAEADARALAGFYTTHPRSPADPDRVLSLLGRAATRAAALQAIRHQLVQRATEATDVAVLYFAGHGFADSADTYLACADTTLAALPETSISLAALQTSWDRIRAGTKVLITDACHAGALANLRGVGGVRTVLPARPAGGRVGTVSIVASGENELSAEDPELGRGVFTAALVNGLSGDADRDGDRVVSLGELAGYLRDEVPRHARAVGGNQEPMVRFAPGAETLPLTR